MPDTTTTYASRRADSIHDAIRRERRPLPPHDLVGINLRRWAAAVCHAEVKHADGDFWRVVHSLGLAGMFDRHDDPDASARYRLPHEVHAGAALVWLSHLQTHDSDRHGPWARWERWNRQQRVAWLRRRRYLLHGFLKLARTYQQARREIMPARAA